MIRWKIAQWFELKWWKNYLTSKSKPEYIAWKTNYWLSLIDSIGQSQRVSKAKTIADFGCGPFGLALANNNWQKRLVAIDPLLSKYESQISFFSKADYPATSFITKAIEEFGVNEKFDVVFCMNAINHVHDIEKAYDVVCGSCAETGRIIISIDAHNFAFFKHLFRLLPGDILHPYQFDLKEYKAFMEVRGFKIIKEHCSKREFFFDHYVLVASPQQ